MPIKNKLILKKIIVKPSENDQKEEASKLQAELEKAVNEYFHLDKEEESTPLNEIPTLELALKTMKDPSERKKAISSWLNQLIDSSLLVLSSEDKNVSNIATEIDRVYASNTRKNITSNLSTSSSQPEETKSKTSISTKSVHTKVEDFEHLKNNADIVKILKDAFLSHDFKTFINKDKDHNNQLSKKIITILENKSDTDQSKIKNISTILNNPVDVDSLDEKIHNILLNHIVNNKSSPQIMIDELKNIKYGDKDEHTLLKPDYSFEGEPSNTNKGNVTSTSESKKTNDKADEIAKTKLIAALEESIKNLPNNLKNYYDQNKKRYHEKISEIVRIDHIPDTQKISANIIEQLKNDAEVEKTVNAEIDIFKDPNKFKTLFGKELDNDKEKDFILKTLHQNKAKYTAIIYNAKDSALKAKLIDTVHRKEMPIGKEFMDEEIDKVHETLMKDAKLIQENKNLVTNATAKINDIDKSKTSHTLDLKNLTDLDKTKIGSKFNDEMKAHKNQLDNAINEAKKLINAIDLTTDPKAVEEKISSALKTLEGNKKQYDEKIKQATTIAEDEANKIKEINATKKQIEDIRSSLTSAIKTTETKWTAESIDAILTNPQITDKDAIKKSAVALAVEQNAKITNKIKEMQIKLDAINPELGDAATKVKELWDNFDKEYSKLNKEAESAIKQHIEDEIKKQIEAESKKKEEAKAAEQKAQQEEKKKQIETTISTIAATTEDAIENIKKPQSIIQSLATSPDKELIILHLTSNQAKYTGIIQNAKVRADEILRNATTSVDTSLISQASSIMGDAIKEAQKEIEKDAASKANELELARKKQEEEEAKKADEQKKQAELEGQKGKINAGIKRLDDITIDIILPTSIKLTAEEKEALTKTFSQSLDKIKQDTKGIYNDALKSVENKTESDKYLEQAKTILSTEINNLKNAAEIETNKIQEQNKLQSKIDAEIKKYDDKNTLGILKTQIMALLDGEQKTIPGIDNITDKNEIVKICDKYAEQSVKDATTLAKEKLQEFKKSTFDEKQTNNLINDAATIANTTKPDLENFKKDLNTSVQNNNKPKVKEIIQKVETYLNKIKSSDEQNNSNKVEIEYKERTNTLNKFISNLDNALKKNIDNDDKTSINALIQKVNNTRSELETRISNILTRSKLIDTIADTIKDDFEKSQHTKDLLETKPTGNEYRDKVKAASINFYRNKAFNTVISSLDSKFREACNEDKTTDPISIKNYVISQALDEIKKADSSVVTDNDLNKIDNAINNKVIGLETQIANEFKTDTNAENAAKSKLTELVNNNKNSLLKSRIVPKYMDEKALFDKQYVTKDDKEILNEAIAVGKLAAENLVTQKLKEIRDATENQKMLLNKDEKTTAINEIGNYNTIKTVLASLLDDLDLLKQNNPQSTNLTSITNQINDINDTIITTKTLVDKAKEVLSREQQIEATRLAAIAAAKIDINNQFDTTAKSTAILKLLNQHIDKEWKHPNPHQADTINKAKILATKLATQFNQNLQDRINTLITQLELEDNLADVDLGKKNISDAISDFINSEISYMENQITTLLDNQKIIDNIISYLNDGLNKSDAELKEAVLVELLNDNLIKNDFNVNPPAGGSIYQAAKTAIDSYAIKHIDPNTLDISASDNTRNDPIVKLYEDEYKKNLNEALLLAKQAAYKTALESEIKDLYGDEKKPEYFIAKLQSTLTPTTAPSSSSVPLPSTPVHGSTPLSDSSDRKHTSTPTTPISSSTTSTSHSTPPTPNIAASTPMFGLEIKDDKEYKLIFDIDRLIANPTTLNQAEKEINAAQQLIKKRQDAVKLNDDLKEIEAALTPSTPLSIESKYDAKATPEDNLLNDSSFVTQLKSLEKGLQYAMTAIDTQRKNTKLKLSQLLNYDNATFKKNIVSPDFNDANTFINSIPADSDAPITTLLENKNTLITNRIKALDEGTKWAALLPQVERKAYDDKLNALNPNIATLKTLKNAIDNEIKAQNDAKKEIANVLDIMNTMSKYEGINSINEKTFSSLKDEEKTTALTFILGVLDTLKQPLDDAENAIDKVNHTKAKAALNKGLEDTRLLKNKFNNAKNALDELKVKPNKEYIDEKNIQLTSEIKAIADTNLGNLDFVGKIKKLNELNDETIKPEYKYTDKTLIDKKIDEIRTNELAALSKKLEEYKKELDNLKAEVKHTEKPVAYTDKLKQYDQLQQNIEKLEKDIATLKTHYGKVTPPTELTNLQSGTTKLKHDELTAQAKEIRNWDWAAVKKPDDKNSNVDRIFYLVRELYARTKDLAFLDSAFLTQKNITELESLKKQAALYKDQLNNMLIDPKLTDAKLKTFYEEMRGILDARVLASIDLAIKIQNARDEDKEFRIDQSRYVTYAKNNITECDDFDPEKSIEENIEALKKGKLSDKLADPEKPANSLAGSSLVASTPSDEAKFAIKSTAERFSRFVTSTRAVYCPLTIDRESKLARSGFLSYIDKSHGTHSVKHMPDPKNDAAMKLALAIQKSAYRKNFTFGDGTIPEPGSTAPLPESLIKLCNEYINAYGPVTPETLRIFLEAKSQGPEASMEISGKLTKYSWIAEDIVKNYATIGTNLFKNKNGDDVRLPETQYFEAAIRMLSNIYRPGKPVTLSGGGSDPRLLEAMMLICAAKNITCLNYSGIYFKPSADQIKYTEYLLRPVSTMEKQKLSIEKDSITIHNVEKFDHKAIPNKNAYFDDGYPAGLLKARRLLDEGLKDLPHHPFQTAKSEYLFEKVDDTSKATVKPGTIYIDDKGNYAVQGLEGKTQKGKLEGIEITNLETQIKDELFKKAILDFTSKAGHASEEVTHDELAKLTETRIKGFGKSGG